MAQNYQNNDSGFAFEKEKLDQLDKDLSPVMQLSLEELCEEALGYLGDREYKVWKSISTNKGKLRDPRLDKDCRNVGPFWTLHVI